MNESFDKGSGAETMDKGEQGDADSVWRYAMATRAQVIIDADAYFELVREAMINAQQRIFMIGWDFDTRIHLAATRNTDTASDAGKYPTRLGSLIIWLAKRRNGPEIRLLKWNISFVKSLFRGSMVIDLIRWARRKRVTFKFDSAHPTGASHHQKIVVIDDRVAVCGGIDMTSDRWDTRSHLHEDIRRRLPNGKPYTPWHDVTMMMEGEIAEALSELGRERWEIAGGKPMEPCRPQEQSPWPERMVAEFENVEIGIARTRAAHNGTSQICEIESLFLEHIARARRFIYAETQYFASRKIADAIARRLAEPDPPEIMIINPRHADGWLEQEAMDSARVQLVRALKQCDHADRFRIFVPHTSGGTPIYVHAKLTVVDDEILRVGSANMNNRSMGLDSECDVFIDAARPANAHVTDAITRIRISLMAEHCGVSIEDMEDALSRHDSMAAAIIALSDKGKRLHPLPLDELNGVEEMLGETAILDPERPEQMFEPMEKRGLFRRSVLSKAAKPLRHVKKRIART